VNIDDVASRREAPNVDSGCMGTIVARLSYAPSRVISKRIAVDVALAYEGPTPADA
jgi:hypothetical protein